MTAAVPQFILDYIYCQTSSRIFNPTEIYYQIRGWLEGTYTLRIIDNFFELFYRIGPYLLISIAINVAVVRFFKDRKITFSGRSEIFSIISAALLGLISPLPTYVAIPIGASLIAAGIPFSAIMAFVISSPLMNPSIFFLTATQMGMEMAIARTLAAFSIGLIGGFLSIKIFKKIFSGAASLPEKKKNDERSLPKEIYRNTLYVGKTFSIAIFLSAAVKAFFSPETITNVLGGNAASGTLVAMALGVPFYTCGGAAIPFMQTLMELGLAKGAVLAFFITGPATKLETIYTYKKILGLKVLIFFMALTLIFSYLASVVYSLF